MVNHLLLVRPQSGFDIVQHIRWVKLLFCHQTGLDIERIEDGAPPIYLFELFVKARSHRRVRNPFIQSGTRKRDIHPIAGECPVCAGLAEKKFLQVVFIQLEDYFIAREGEVLVIELGGYVGRNRVRIGSVRWAAYCLGYGMPDETLECQREIAV